MKKNCVNCKHLEYVEDDGAFPQSGFCCNKRDYFKYSQGSATEKRHLKKLESEKYRQHAKHCCELKEGGIRL